MAGRAQKGPLTIMRSLAKEANEEQKKKQAEFYVCYDLVR